MHKASKLALKYETPIFNHLRLFYIQKNVMNFALSPLFQYKKYDSLKTWQHKTKMLLLLAEMMWQA